MCWWLLTTWAPCQYKTFTTNRKIIFVKIKPTNTTIIKIININNNKLVINRINEQEKMYTKILYNKDYFNRKNPGFSP